MAKEITQDPISKKCGTNCPNCGADEDEIYFDCIVAEDVIYQKGTCNKCSCEFKMYFDYTDTEFYLEQCKRVPCPFPMSKFFATMDEVPKGAKASDPETDCKDCDDTDCEENNCLVTDSLEADYVKILYEAAKKVSEHEEHCELADAIKNYERRRK